MTSIVYPSYYLIFQHEGPNWFALKPKRVFFNPSDKPVNIENPEEQFGLSLTQIVFELFRVKTGRQGYYLADLKHRKYYYCGLEFETVRTTLKSLGIGREDPRS